MRSTLIAACLVSAACTVAATAQSPVAYVYVAEDYPTPTSTSPITAYAASPDGRLTPMQGSPFTQTSGFMAGTDGSHFITLDNNYQTTHQYLHVYDAAPSGVIGKEVFKQDMHGWCAQEVGAEFDHTGQYVYVLDDPQCGRGIQCFALNHTTGALTFAGSVDVNPPLEALPTFSGNDKFAYLITNSPDSGPPCPTYTFQGLGKETSGALEDISFIETDPTPPAEYSTYQAFQQGLVTDDPTNHLAAEMYFGDQTCDSSEDRLVSYTVESNGNIVSTNKWEDMPQVGPVPAGYEALNSLMKSNPAGTVLAVTIGGLVQFFHFNGAAPITPFTGVIGNPNVKESINYISWDNANHLYALDSVDGKLHVYTVTKTGGSETPGSPYLPPNSCTSGGCSPQSLIVRIVP